MASEVFCLGEALSLKWKKRTTNFQERNGNGKIFHICILTIQSVSVYIYIIFYLSDEGLTLKTSAFLPFTVANLHFQPSC